MTSPAGVPVGGDRDEELAFAGVARLLALLRAGEVTSRELVELYLARITRLDEQLHAFTVVLADSARAAADDADRQRAAGATEPLLGLPIAVKDNLDVVGVPTRYGTGSPELPAAFDAELVHRLRAAGCVLLGKTTMPELALFPFGPARNPWDPTRTSGGSSSGSATAVAAGLAPAATASDGGGSIRIPAAYCGLVGLKPTPGLVPLGPDREHWYGLSSFGFLTRSVTDTAQLIDAVRTDGSSLGPLDGPAAPLRIGLTRHGGKAPKTVPLHPEAFTALDDTAGRLAGLGHAVGPLELSIGYLQSAFVPLYLRGARDDSVRLAQPRALGGPTRLVTRLGGMVSDRQVAAARRRGDAHRTRLARVFESVDVLLMPTVPAPAAPAASYERLGALPTVLASTDQVGYTTPWNVVGFPAVSLPAGLSRDGLPLAIQLVGPPGSEARLLQVAAQLEADEDWSALRPKGLGPKGLGQSNPR
ncbi:MAG: amidase [Frankiaceae bacterium]|nr:amidase [Frankiaceae bacterium]